MKIYVAASLNFTFIADLYADTLRDAGFVVTSLWHTPGFIDNGRAASKARGEDERTFKKHMAEVDMRGVLDADVVLLSTEDVSSSGGYHVELGIALQSRKPIVVLGKHWQSNVFYYLDGVIPAEGFDHALSILRSIKVEPYENCVIANVSAHGETTFCLMPPETVSLRRIYFLTRPAGRNFSVLEVLIRTDGAAVSYMELLRVPGRRVNIKDLEALQPWVGEVLRLGEVRVTLRNEDEEAGEVTMLVAGSILPKVDRPTS
jgi:hypothetical protein